MERRFVRIIPGSYIVWTNPNGITEGATVKVGLFEVPSGCSYVGAWTERPESDVIKECVEMGIGLN